MKVERDIEIAASPEDVYEVIMDPRRLKDWVTIHRRLKEAPEGALREGSELRQTMKVAGQGFEVRWKVVEATRPSHVVWEGDGPMGTSAKVVYDLEPAGEGTHFSYLNEYELPGGALGSLAGRAVAGMAGRESEASLEKLKALLERSS